MIYLADTNILLRFIDTKHLFHARAAHAIKGIQQGGDAIQTTLQNCVEFWNVATRPIERNGLGFSVAEVDFALSLIEQLFPIVPDTPEIYAEWRRLVVTYRVSGVQVHDARLVALMKVHGLTHILTLNRADFARYSPEGIVAIEPAQPDIE